MSDNEKFNMAFERLKQKKVEIDSSAPFFLYATIAIIVIGFVAGIICGSVFSVVDVTGIGEYLSSFETEEKFNTGMMFVVWASTAITALISWAVHCILNSLDSIHFEIKRIRMYNEYAIDLQFKENTEKE